MNVGVLGACGFIGRNMVNELENQGCLSYDVIGIIKNKNEKSIYVI